MPRDYTNDGSYWTVRKRGRVYWVARIKPTGDGRYPWVEIWGGYERAGAAGGAAAQLAYAQGQRDAINKIRDSLHGALDNIGLGLPMPMAAPVRPSPEMIAMSEWEDEVADDDESL